MPAFPITQHSWNSKAEAIPNADSDTTESGKRYPYLITESEWYEVTLVIAVWHDKDGATAKLIDDFYNANKTDESITFVCKGYTYSGNFIARPVPNQLRGFGMYEITCKFHAERTGKV